jgi:hypothetical protein
MKAPKKSSRLATVAIVVVGISGLLVFSPPAKWRRVRAGMSRTEVYAILGQPGANTENIKGGVRWRSNAVVGRWEMDVFFGTDDRVVALARRSRW